MEHVEYARLAEFETWYWWYRAQRHALIDALRRLELSPGSSVLDAGCGTGRNLVEVVEALNVVGYGIDISPVAAKRWNGNANVYRQVASVNAIPYGAGRFDIVFSVDVLCCDGVDPGRSVREMARVLRADGALVLLVPAYPSMCSRHDAAVHCVRRFRRSGLRALLSGAGLRVERTTHLYAPFLPLIAAKRWWDRRCANGSAPTSDLQPLPRWLNETLLAIALGEQRMARHADLPVGSTILAVAHKESA